MYSERIGFSEIEGVIVSTVSPWIMAWYGEYETAIEENGFIWRIVEGYNTEEEAIAGHKKYSRMSKEELLNLEFIG